MTKKNNNKKKQKYYNRCRVTDEFNGLASI